MSDRDRSSHPDSPPEGDTDRRSDIEKAVDSAYEDVNEEKQARNYLRRKRLNKPKDQKQTARIFRQLARAGFGSRTIFSILKKWDVDEETLTALEGESS